MWLLSERGTTNAIFIVCHLQREQLTAKKPVYMAFMDLEKKACLSNVMFWAMHKIGIDKWLVQLIQSMYEDVGSRVRVDDGYSQEIGYRVGVP